MVRPRPAKHLHGGIRFDAQKWGQADGVVTGTAAVNHASCRLLKKLSLKKTGQSRGSFRNAPDGKPMEFIGYTFAITRDEWNAARRDKGAG